MKISKILGMLGTALCCVALFIFGGFSLSEGYNPAKPEIDTRMSDQFEESRFKEIKVGMDTAQVVALIGKPLGKEGRTIQRWFWTLDGKCKWGDFAWMARAVVIDQNGKVKLIQESTRYE
jgi:outer membrane protein assembly factor BamE (lipoprotein component of BamABCDE complex)